MGCCAGAGGEHHPGGGSGVQCGRERAGIRGLHHEKRPGQVPIACACAGRDARRGALLLLGPALQRLQHAVPVPATALRRLRSLLPCRRGCGSPPRLLRSCGAGLLLRPPLPRCYPPHCHILLVHALDFPCKLPISPLPSITFSRPVAPFIWSITYFIAFHSKIETDSINGSCKIDVR